MRGSMNWSVSGATRSVWHSVLAKRVFYFPAGWKNEISTCVCIKASGSTCHLCLLYLFSGKKKKKKLIYCLTFSCKACRNEVLHGWLPLPTSLQLTASQRCPLHNSLLWNQSQLWASPPFLWACISAYGHQFIKFKFQGSNNSEGSRKANFPYAAF